MESINVPLLNRCLEVLGFEDGLKVHTACLSNEFRNANSLNCQIEIIRNAMPTIDVRHLCAVMNISTRKYYKTIKGVSSNKENIAFCPPPTQLLTTEEEEIIIQNIRSAQINNDCLTGKNVRDLASNLYRNRTTKIREFSRDWCWKFLQRHSDKIAKVSASSIDDSRASIDLNEVERYIHEIEQVMNNPPIPQLLINFDETGFGRRPEKGKRKKVFVCRDCNMEAFWREDTEQHHISLVTAISAACTSLKPLLLSTRKTMDSDLAGTFFYRWGSYAYTQKGYMTQQSMVYWVKNNLAPYIKYIRDNTTGPHHCVIICDGCSSHFGSEVMQAFEEIGNIKIIFLPPHSSHLTQMLDVSLFSVLKRRYSSTPKDESLSSKFTQKLIRIKKAYQSCVNEELIKSSWEAAGFKLIIQNGDVIGYWFSEEFKLKLRAEASHTEN